MRWRHLDRYFKLGSFVFIFCKQNTAYAVRISAWCSDVCSSDLPTPQIIPPAEALIQATGADMRIGGSDAFYAPSDDYVQVPPLAAFRDANDFYDTALDRKSTRLNSSH